MGKRDYSRAYSVTQILASLIGQRPQSSSASRHTQSPQVVEAQRPGYHHALERMSPKPAAAQSLPTPDSASAIIKVSWCRQCGLKGPGKPIATKEAVERPTVEEVPTKFPLHRRRRGVAAP